MSLAIRDAVCSDLDGVVALCQCCDLTRPWNDPAKDFDLALASPASTILIAEPDGALAGTAMVGFDGHRGWISYLAVAPEARGRGIARRLLDRCAEWLGDHGCLKVQLMVRANNPAAELYEHLGWERQDVLVYGCWLSETVRG